MPTRGIGRPTPVVPAGGMHDADVQRGRKTVVVPSGRTIAGAERLSVGQGTRIVDLTFEKTEYGTDEGGAPLPTGEMTLCWSVGQCIVAPVANPLDQPCTYFQRIYIPGPFLLDRYQYGLIADGTASDGALWVNVFAETTGTEYGDSRAMALHDGVPQGCVDLYCGVGVDFSVHKTVLFPQGWVWAGITVDTDSSAGILMPGIDYFDAGEVRCVGRGGRKTVGFSGGFAEMTDMFVVPFRNSPAVYLHGTLL
jgi:hypothetical protein